MLKRAKVTLMEEFNEEEANRTRTKMGTTIHWTSIVWMTKYSERRREKKDAANVSKLQSIDVILLLLFAILFISWISGIIDSWNRTTYLHRMEFMLVYYELESASLISLRWFIFEQHTHKHTHANDRMKGDHRKQKPTSAMKVNSMAKQ